MSAATRKSSQNRRTKIPRFRQRVADSRRDYNSKTADCARKQRVRSKEQRARSKEQSAFKFRIQEVSLLVSLFHHSMFHAPCSMLPALCFLRKLVLRPGIGGVNVAADFPETRLIFGNEFNRANKLGPFPR